MALQGDINFWLFRQNGTEMVDVDIPENIDEEHPHYESRGTTIQLEQPIMERYLDEERSFQDVYVVIQSCGFTQHNYSKDDKIWYLSIMYKVFESKESKDNLDTPLYLTDWTPMVDIDIESEEFNSQNIVDFAYNQLKIAEPFETMESV